MSKSKKFRYLESIIHQEGEIGKDVNHRVKAKWVKWKSTSKVLYDLCIPLKLKEKIYTTTIRLIDLFDFDDNKSLSWLLI